MYTLNISFKVDHEIENDWLDWMKGNWLMKVSQSLEGSSYQLHSLIGHDDEQGKNFVLQYYVESSDLLNKYLRDDQSDLQQQIITRWGDRAVFFQTILKKVRL